MDIVETRKLSYDYIRVNENNVVIEKTQAIQDLNLKIEEGSFVCVLGHNGSGKSTFSRLLNGLILPTEGSVLIGGIDTRDSDRIWDIRRDLGMVFQNPDNQIIASVVEEDIGFGPENIGVATREIWKRVEAALDAVRMKLFRKHSPNRLSGGQKQRVAIAGTMAMKPKCIVLDEPTAMLDPSGRIEVLSTIHRLNKEQGVTIILITHNMEECVSADRILVMNEGRISMDGSPYTIFSEADELKKYRLVFPPVANLSLQIIKKGVPLSGIILHRDELAKAIITCFGKGLYEGSSESETSFSGNIYNDGASESDNYLIEDTSTKDNFDAVIKVEGLSYLYQPGTAMEQQALKDLSFSIPRGKITALIGQTGSGKSTLVQHLNGLLRGSDGRILVKFRDETFCPLANRDKEGYVNIYDKGFVMRELRFKVGLVFQYPEYQLFEIDVLKDVMFGPKNEGLSDSEARKRAEEALNIIGISEDLWHKSPFELSGGQKRRVAIAGVLAMRPEVLVLDEPTAGLDPESREELFRQISDMMMNQSITVLLVSHSMEDVARYSDWILAFYQGKLKLSGKPGEVFKAVDELERIGLSVPESVYLASDLKKAGLCLSAFPLTSEEAATEIANRYKAFLR